MVPDVVRMRRSAQHVAPGWRPGRLTGGAPPMREEEDQTHGGGDPSSSEHDHAPPADGRRAHNAGGEELEGRHRADDGHDRHHDPREEGPQLAIAHSLGYLAGREAEADEPS